jgi:putative addiction module killer protein
MIEVRQSARFTEWLLRLRDIGGRARILARLARVRAGNLGDTKFFDGIGELRVDTGPSYRLYFVKRGNRVIVMLCGGDKSTQSKDIAMAIAMAKEI